MNKPKPEVAVGLFVVIGFVILSMIVFFVSGVYFFRDGYHIRVDFDYVGIINRGAPVRFAGVRVGEVTDVNVVKAQQTDKSDRVEITFFVEKDVQIRDNYPISIRGNHIMSEPHIEITPTVGEGRFLKDGDVVNGVSPYSTDAMMKQLDDAATKVMSLLDGADQFFSDPTKRKMMTDSFDNMSKLLASMNQITVGHEQEFREMVQHLSRSTEQLGQLIEKINKGEGTLGKLVNEDEIYNDLRDFVKEIKERPWRLFKK